jgi:Cu(I)/Ag(I) efflux system membrane fusion protein
MKKTIKLSVLAFALTISACNNQSTDDSKKENIETQQMQMLDTTKLAKGTVFYQCPMHLEVTSDKPGTCPKCGMDLEKVEKY